MEVSKHVITGKLKDSSDYYIVNPLSRQADILTKEVFQEFSSGSYPNADEFIEKGYLVDPEEEKKLFTREYLDFIDRRESDEVQIFYLPTYACNFACPYCYQEGYEHTSGENQHQVIDAFFSYLDTAFSARKKYLTIFGGEPLLRGLEKTIEQLIEGSAERNLDAAVVTNGYTLVHYIPILKKARIREIQVTLDGPEQVHNSRRMLKNSSGTFREIVEGIDAALEAGIPINLRVVTDRDNMPHLGELADFASRKGWTANPLFKTQLGRNYELHTCQSDRNKLYTRLGLYEDIYKLVKGKPEFLEFHRPSYSISKFLFENGEMPNPLFDSCPACKTEWAFDFTGRIYSCTATVGKQGEELGTFYPGITRNQEIIDQWELRDVTSIPECRLCPLQLACGGGCGSVAKNQSGNILSPDCRPVGELLSMGLSQYFLQDTQEQT